MSPRFFLTVLYDEGVSITGKDADQDKKLKYLEKAKAFCDAAILYNRVLDPESEENRIETTYYYRAMVYCRLAEAYARIGDESNRCNAVRNALKDIRSAICEDDDYLLQATFDEKLVKLMRQESFKWNAERYDADKNREDLENRFLCDRR